MKATLSIDGKTYEASNLTSALQGGSVVILDGVVLHGDFINTKPVPPPAADKPSTVTYQAETGSYDPTAAVSKKVSGFTGAGYVALGGNASYLSIPNVNRKQRGEAILRFRTFTNGKDRPCELIVNGASKGILPMKGNAVWSYDQVAVFLDEGANTVRLVAVTPAGGPLVDVLQVSDLAPAAPAPAVAPQAIKQPAPPAPAPVAQGNGTLAAPPQADAQGEQV